MSEAAKRPQLIPLPGPSKEAERPPREPRKTLRIKVALPESTEDTCPEYNYKDEAAAVAKKTSKKKERPRGAANGVPNRFEDGDNDDDVRRIALEMEAKYGTGTATDTRKRKGRKDDYADIGMGYDETDSFIDNTDGYDEMIPKNVTTLHGGFYINSGALEFKTDDEANSDITSSSEDEAPKKVAGRKRVLESSDETDKETKTEKKKDKEKEKEKDKSRHAEKKRKLQNGNGVQPSLKKKLLNPNKLLSPNKLHVKKRRALEPDKKTVKELLREKRVDLNMSIPEDLLNKEGGAGGAAPEDPAAKDKKHMSIANVANSIESVVKAASTKDKQKPKAAAAEDNSSNNKVIAISSSSESESSHQTHSADSAISTKAPKPLTTTEPPPPSTVKLPENLPVEIVDIITAIKTALTRAPDGKSGEINNLILRLERKCKCLGKPSKMKVYEHLAVPFRCKLEVLIRKAKDLVLDDEQRRLINNLAGLRSEVGKIMPGLLESHEKESQKILQRKFSQDGPDNPDSKSLRLPKRRFQWNDVSKKLLKDILMMKKRCLLLEGKSKDVLDVLMLNFLKSEIQVIWPEGWMSMNALNKIYTTYADPRRSGHNGSGSQTSSPVPPGPSSTAPTSTVTSTSTKPQQHQNQNPHPQTSSSSANPSSHPSNNPLKSLAQDPHARLSPKSLTHGFNTPNLSITPITVPIPTGKSGGDPPAAAKIHKTSSSSATSSSAASALEVTVKNVVNLTVKPVMAEKQPQPPAISSQPCEIIPAPPPPRTFSPKDPAMVVEPVVVVKPKPQPPPPLPPPPPSQQHQQQQHSVAEVSVKTQKSHVDKSQHQNEAAPRVKTPIDLGSGSGPSGGGGVGGHHHQQHAKKEGGGALNLVSEDNSVIILDRSSPKIQLPLFKDSQPHKALDQHHHQQQQQQQQRVVSPIKEQQQQQRPQSRSERPLSRSERPSSRGSGTTDSGYCQVIDLSDKSEAKAAVAQQQQHQQQQQKQQPITTVASVASKYPETTISPLNPLASDPRSSGRGDNYGLPSKQPPQQHQHHELSITPSFPTTSSSASSSKQPSSGITDHQRPPRSSSTTATSTTSSVAASYSASTTTGDDIMQVMENLKALQSMSSPKKAVPEAAAATVSSSAASASVTSRSSNTLHRHHHHQQQHQQQQHHQQQKQRHSSSSSSAAAAAAAAVSSVSVIAINKNFAPKATPPLPPMVTPPMSVVATPAPIHTQSSSTMQRVDYPKPEYPKADYNTSFQDEFTKLLAMGQLSPSPTTSAGKNSYNNSSSIDRYHPHIGSSGAAAGLVSAGDKYFQSSNNNYSQSSNGHKGGAPVVPQPATPSSKPQQHHHHQQHQHHQHHQHQK